METTMTYNSYEKLTAGITVIFFFLALAVAAVALSAHAIEKHGSEAILAHQCIDKPNLIFVNPSNGRTAFVCKIDGKWGIAIVDKDGREITAFIKNKFKSVSQIFRYMRNTGYQILH